MSTPIPCPDCFGPNPERCPEHSDAALARQNVNRPRVTVACRNCGGDWELALPPAGELTVEYCECGALLELDAAGLLRSVWRSARVPADPTPEPAGDGPRRLAELVRRFFGGRP